MDGEVELTMNRAERKSRPKEKKTRAKFEEWIANIIREINVNSAKKCSINMHLFNVVTVIIHVKNVMKDRT